ncbi:MAG: DNA repair protein RecO [Firmicutes bacterium]|nr:DNA repair protein RecO [Bacillota bacterium]
MSLRGEGIVLRVRNMGEADRVVTIYTAHYGKIRAVARGARRVRNRLLSPTQVFTHGRYLVFPGKGLHTISQAEIVNSYQEFRDDLEKMAYASYITELLDSFTEEELPSQELFMLLIAAFSLGTHGRFALAARAFEVRLMQELGYAPQLHHCLGCGSAVQENLRFSPEGGVVCPRCAPRYRELLPLSNGTWELMKRLTEWDVSRFGILHPSPVALGELERIMRNYIDFRLDYPLKSLEFLETVKAMPKDGSD